MKFDYVIVGGGTAGCVLASRLSEDASVRVAVVEAGPRYRGLPIHVPAAVGDLYAKGQYHWGYQSAAEPGAKNKKLPYKLGRILGGSSAINGMVWVRGNPGDYNGWAASGCEGWCYDDVEPIFRRIECFESGHGNEMGQGGPIPVMSGCPEKQVLNSAFMQSGAEAGFPFNPNYNSKNQHGFCALQRNTHNGRRGDVYQGYLKPVLKRPNLTIISDACVERILIKNKQARGIEYRHKDHLKQLEVTREVLLTAGSLATPQILELSGIGDPDVLQSNGIELKHNLPGVGKNLHTHPTISCSYDCLKPVSIYSDTGYPGRWIAGLQWLLRRSGPAATNHFEAGAFLKTDPALDQPDIEITFLPLAMDNLTQHRKGHGFQFFIELIGCKSRGSTHIQSTDIRQQPCFKFNFLQHDQDLIAYQKSIEIVRKLVSQPAFHEYRGTEIAPGTTVQSEVEMTQWLRDTVTLSHHLVGSCRMGSPGHIDTVVDPQLKLIGIENLRVADASVMPRVVSGNTHAAVIMIAEKAGDMIRARHQ
ncbi:MAG: choline dehydrogenase [Gammaproteobacteria bacterium]|nr:choline dehydrogenase [Gammaproteobacteria bacterium]